MYQISSEEIYNSSNKIRIVTSTSLFDGHDASINIMRRVLQETGAEIIHLGHNRSVEDIVKTAIQEDAQGIAISSYQGGHIEFFKYMRDLLNKNGYSHIKIFGGGGGVIIPNEIKELHDYGITKIFSPDDGRKMGLQGMINLIMKECDFNPLNFEVQNQSSDNYELWSKTARLITKIENNLPLDSIEKSLQNTNLPPVILGITGTGGAGKSSLTDELLRRFSNNYPDYLFAVISIDPSKRKTGGALLADRIRMNTLSHKNNIYMRSLATRKSNTSISGSLTDILSFLKSYSYNLIIIETSGIGQSGSEIVDLSDHSIYVMTSEYGAASQLEKIDMIDFADLIAINKFERKGSTDALRDVRKQYRRSRKLFDQELISDENLPIYGTIASKFNDQGVNQLYQTLIDNISANDNSFKLKNTSDKIKTINLNQNYIIPPNRSRYLSEIAETIRDYKKWVASETTLVRKYHALSQSLEILKDEAKENNYPINKSNIDSITQSIDKHRDQISPETIDKLNDWDSLYSKYTADEYSYKVRNKVIKVETFTKTLSNIKIPKVSFPKFHDWGDRIKWLLLENVSGSFPFTSGVYPFKRTQEDPTRMFAGEGLAENTNKRFHYLSSEQQFARLSTAFDSVTLYGEDPDFRPDIFGKIGNSGVSISTVEDMERLYAGFDLTSNSTSVSMTINGPAPIILAYFFNTAIRQQIRHWVVQNKLLTPGEAYIRTGDNRYGFNVHSGESWVVDSKTPKLKEWKDIQKLVPPKVFTKIENDTLQKVRGTVQADILKEDQAQNTCIFSTDFSLRMMGDVQQYFINNNIKNYYSVSISGYHIAEAGANPITQVAFTLANGFTYLEYYKSRGMNIDDFAPNFSFFFSNGLDAEYSVIGRVARRIWSIALKNLYGANKRSQMLKYHIQTSGRSLHAQEIDFNDIRTTLQALLAIYGNANSLHTNAYDEAVTTPTEDSVRRAMAIQLIINKELGIAKNENINQGSFIINELTELVEEAVLDEFERIADRGGVLGAMETQYQRGKIQEESLNYETKKSLGQLEIIGVNSFLNPNRENDILEVSELIRSSSSEKELQIKRLNEFKKRNSDLSKQSLSQLQSSILAGSNIFTELMIASQFSSLGQISSTLYNVGGEYRRNL